MRTIFIYFLLFVMLAVMAYSIYFRSKFNPFPSPRKRLWPEVVVTIYIIGLNIYLLTE